MRDEYKNKIADKIAARFTDLEERIMKDIVRRIRKTGEHLQEEIRREHSQ